MWPTAGTVVVGVRVGTGNGPGVMGVIARIGFGIPRLANGTVVGRTARDPKESPGGHVEGPGIGPEPGPVTDFPKGKSG